MSRNIVILLVVLCAGVAGLIVFSKMRSGLGSQASQASEHAESQPPTRVANTDSQAGTRTPNDPARVGTTTPLPASGAQVGGVTTEPGRSTIAAQRPSTLTSQPPRTGTSLAPINLANTNEVPELKPLPVLEKDYASATNRDTRLDIMMDIAETPGADSVRTLTRLFEVETDGDLKVDLIDSLLGIEGFKEEKLIMLTMGARQGLPTEVRQSAIDGLIDLDDARVIPVLNGLLNDADPDIREGAQDALEMLQSAQTQPAVKLIGK
jgi:hypothetical protein